MSDSPTIVSLLASATEIVCGLGLRDQLIGRSHECDYPADIKHLPVLSAPKIDPAQPSGEIDRRVRDIVRNGLSVYAVHVDALERLKPDLIVTQDQCDVCAVSLTDVEDALCRVTLTNTKVSSLHPENLDDIFRDFERVAQAAGVPQRGARLSATVRRGLDDLAARTAGRARPRVVMVEWLDPVMVAGGWIPELVRIAGGDPLIVQTPQAFKTVEWRDLIEADPDVVVIMPCGYAVSRTLEELSDSRIGEAVRAIPATERGRTDVADGNAYFNRPGPRIADSARLLAGILHPEAFEDQPPHLEQAYQTWH